MELKKLSEYLAPEAIKNMTIHTSRIRDDMDGVDEDCCLLSDGTVISINKIRGGLKIPDGFLNNPYNISIESESLIIVKFKENENDDKYKSVRFRVSSLPDLENQWKKYRAVKQLGDVYGTISSIEMTKEQMDANSKMAILVNQFLNIVLQDDIDIFACSPEVGKDRYKVISSIITNTVNELVLSKAYDSVYCPTLIKDVDGIPVSIVDRIDKKFIISKMKDVYPFEELDDGDDYE